jgi:hypothetical protein
VIVLGSSYASLALRHAVEAAWGWIVLSLGAALLLIAAALRERFVIAGAGAKDPDAIDNLGHGMITPGEQWGVVAASATGETRQTLRGILWERNRTLTEAEIQKLLNAEEIPVASGLTAAEANQLMTRLYEAGVAARKRRTPTT